MLRKLIWAQRLWLPNRPLDLAVAAEQGRQALDFRLKRVVGVTAYLFAMADMNAHGTAVTTPNDVKTALATLWNYVGERGTKTTLVTPVIASKFGQMKLKRETLIKIMIRSFVAACSERTFCERLVIVISDSDAQRHDIDMASLDAYLQHTCRYSDFERDDAPALGTPVGEVGGAEANTTEIAAVGGMLQSVEPRAHGEQGAASLAVE